jgi:hypothetical protein
MGCYDFRMSDPDASEAARALNRVRWGDRVLRRAAATVLERGDVSEAVRAELAEFIAKSRAGADITEAGNRAVCGS